jgi:putative hydroxymethylpyrimidine transport system substrate-binding protein
VAPVTGRARPPALALLLAALLLLLAACGDDGDEAPAASLRPADVILDWFPNADHAGVYGAIEEGYLEDEGVALRPVVPSDPAAALKQVGAGRAPFAISYEPEVLLARAAGIPVRAVAAIAVHPLNGVIVRADRGIARPADLAGKVVGASGLPSDRPLLDTVVSSDGGDPSAVRVRNVGFNLAPALAAGDVDAIIGAYWNVEVPELEAQEVEVEVFRLEENGVPDYDELVLVASDEVIRDDPELVSAVLRGLRRGQDWAAADQAGAADHLLDANPDLDREVLLRQLRLTAPALSPPDAPTLALDPAEWEAYAAWMREAGILERPLDAREAVTAEFLPAPEEAAR